MDRLTPPTEDISNTGANDTAGAMQVFADLRSPLYHQIYVVLKSKIQSGELALGAFLPSENRIASDYAVSRITAKRALNELAQAGFVVRERGRGTRVISRPPPPTIKASVEGWLENMSAMGQTTKAHVLEFDYLPASIEVAEALSIAEGQIVQRAVRVRSHNGEQFSYLVTHIPEDIGSAFDAGDLGRLPLLSLLERNGVSASSARQTISATLADTTVAAALGVDVGSPLLEVRRVVFDQVGRGVEYIQALYRPDRYHYEVLLTRVSSNGANSWSPVTNAAKSQYDEPTGIA